MPNVTVDSSQYERFELKTAPPDGFVMLRPLPFGMKLTRRDKALNMRMVQQRTKKGVPQSDEQIIDLETLSNWSTMFDFTYCVGEHNLTDSADTLLDFTSQRTIEMVFNSLDPKVGSEIAQYIDALNEDEDELMAEDFLKQRGSLSVVGKNESPTDSPTGSE